MNKHWTPYITRQPKTRICIIKRLKRYMVAKKFRELIPDEDEGREKRHKCKGP